MAVIVLRGSKCEQSCMALHWYWHYIGIGSYPSSQSSEYTILVHHYSSTRCVQQIKCVKSARYMALSFQSSKTGFTLSCNVVFILCFCAIIATQPVYSVLSTVFSPCILVKVMGNYIHIRPQPCSQTPAFTTCLEYRQFLLSLKGLSLLQLKFQ